MKIVFQYEDPDKLAEAVEVLINSGYTCHTINADNFDKYFPYLEVGSNIRGYFQPDHAGYINPRKIIEAQCKIAEANNCEIFR